MAVWEARKQVSRWGNQITQVSWTDWVAQDVYYWLEHSFQYASNINCDDELHGLKLSTYAVFTTDFAKCQLTSAWDYGVIALRTDAWAAPKWFNETTFLTHGNTWTWTNNPDTTLKVSPWTVFQDFFWFWVKADNSNMLHAKVITNAQHGSYTVKPMDHNDFTDESITDPTDTWIYMEWAITAILNYNNTRLVVACGTDLWVYYPELDYANPNNPNYDSTIPLEDHWKLWWKKVLSYEAGTVIVWLTCSFEYLKVWAVDEWWNTKVYYYQGNNDLRNTFVYNLVDLTGVRVIRVYSINGIDYYVSSIDWTDWFVNLYKLVWTTPVKLFKQRAWLSMYDVNYKAPYFVWPTSLWAWYWDGKFYIADAYGLFQFTYNPNWIDTGYMKWGLYNNRQVYGVCKNKDYLYVSTQDWCYMMRIIDTWKPPITTEWTSYPWYQAWGTLISREFEWKEWGTITKMLDEIRMNFELNPLTEQNGTIDVFVSPNNKWIRTNLHDYEYMWVVKYDDLFDSHGDAKIEWTDWEYYRVKDMDAYYTWDTNNWDKVWKSFYGWYHAMHITQDSAETRAEKSNLFNDLHGDQSSFKFDWQTITYAIVIKRGTQWQATPIVRQVDIKYHCKDKVNNVYDIN